MSPSLSPFVNESLYDVGYQVDVSHVIRFKFLVATPPSVNEPSGRLAWVGSGGLGQPWPAVASIWGTLN